MLCGTGVCGFSTADGWIGRGFRDGGVERGYILDISRSSNSPPPSRPLPHHHVGASSPKGRIHVDESSRPKRYMYTIMSLRDSSPSPTHRAESIVNAVTPASTSQSPTSSSLPADKLWRTETLQVRDHPHSYRGNTRHHLRPRPRPHTVTGSHPKTRTRRMDPHFHSLIPPLKHHSPIS